MKSSAGLPRASGLVLLVPVLLLLTLVAGVYRNFVPDDLYIYLRFTENLLSGAGPSFNPGEATYGFTSVLWYGLLALVGMSGKLLPAARLLSLACALLALPAMHRLAGRLSGSSWVAAAAALLLAVDAWFVRWSASGMEASLSVLLLLGGFHRHLYEVEEGRGRVGSVLWFSLLALVRPEAFLLLALALAEAALPDGGTRVFAAWRRAARAAGAAVLLLGPWLWYSWWRFGGLLPDTASAKAPGAMLSQAWASLLRTGKLTAVTVALPATLLVLVCVLGVRSRRQPWNGSGWRRHGLLALWLVGLPLLYSASGVTAYSRYLLLWTPLVLACGLAAVWHATAGRRRVVLAVVVLLTASQNLWATGWVLGPASREYSRSMQQVNVKLGRWLGENTPADAVVAVENIGAIGYYSGRKILDMNGLVTPAVIPYKKQGRVGDYLEKHPPDYVIKISPQPDPWSTNGPDLPLQLLQVLAYEKMFITQSGPLYYSLYRVGASLDAEPLVVP